MQVHGSCHCGFIKYEGEADPQKVTLCNCRDCQVLTGTAFRLSVPATQMRWLSGVPSVYVKTAESGARRRHLFCPRCGAPICATADDDAPTAHMLRVGGLDEREQLPPQLRKWCRSALSWSQDVSGVPGIDAQ